MSYQLLILLGVFGSAISEAQYNPLSLHAPDYHDGYDTHRYDLPPKYAFDWAVVDDYSGNNYGHQETRDGYDTKGSYYVHLPDGRLQRVSYYVSGDSGFVAEVTYEGEAHHPEYVPDPYHPNQASVSHKPVYKPAPPSYKPIKYNPAPEPIYHPDPKYNKHFQEPKYNSVSIPKYNPKPLKYESVPKYKAIPEPFYPKTPYVPKINPLPYKSPYSAKIKPKHHSPYAPPKSESYKPKYESYKPKYEPYKPKYEPYKPKYDFYKPKSEPYKPKPLTYSAKPAAYSSEPSPIYVPKPTYTSKDNYIPLLKKYH